jgi:hypothetical protein
MDDGRGKTDNGAAEKLRRFLQRRTINKKANEPVPSEARDHPRVI